MTHIVTTVNVFARPMLDRQDRYFDGVNPEQESYGRVQIVRRTVVEEVTDGRRMVRNSEQTEEVLHDDLDADAVAHLVRTLTTALANSLTVTEGKRS